MGNSLKEYINLNFNNVRNLSEFLSNIGKVPKGTDLSCIHPILHHKNDDLRLQAVKTIGKLESLDYLNILMDIALTDSSTMVRREAVSSIGRMKDKNTIPYLIELLSSEDPKIICQAIRGLLVFKGDTLVDEELKTLRNHPNETISKVKFLVKSHMLDLDCSMRESKIRRFIVARNVYIEELLMLKQADYMAGMDNQDVAPTVKKWRYILEKMKKDGTPFDYKDLTITAVDLMQIGYKGKKIGKTLEELFDFCVLNPEQNQKQILVDKAKSAFDREI